MEERDTAGRHGHVSGNVSYGTVGSKAEVANKDTVTHQHASVGDDRPEIIMVMGRRWSPNVYRSARKASFTREYAWKVAFI